MQLLKGGKTSVIILNDLPFNLITLRLGYHHFFLTAIFFSCSILTPFSFLIGGELFSRMHLKLIGAITLVALIGNSLANRGSQSLEIPALGRPFSLGDLYDVKKDQVVHGPTLWSYERLVDYAEVIDRKTKFEILASEEVSNQQNHFDIGAQIGLSFLGGLVKVSGSAKYLDDRVKTSNTARVSFKYDTKTFVRKLKPTCS